MRVALIGSATIGASPGDVTSTVKGAVITRSGTGLYTITLDDPYTALLACSITMQSAIASDIQAQIVAVDTTTARTVVVRTVVAGVATDIPANDAMFIHIELRNSSS